MRKAFLLAQAAIAALAAAPSNAVARTLQAAGMVKAEVPGRPYQIRRERQGNRCDNGGRGVPRQGEREIARRLRHIHEGRYDAAQFKL